MNVLKQSETTLQEVGPKVKRRVLSHTDEMMLVEVHFEKGGIGSVHSHPHRQLTYIQSGKFEFSYEGEKSVVQAGDSMTFAADAKHGTVCLESGVVLDFFTPCRKDFL